jgi:hypothetical protein
MRSIGVPTQYDGGAQLRSHIQENDRGAPCRSHLDNIKDRIKRMIPTTPMMEDSTRKKHIHAIKQLLHNIPTQKQKVIPTTKKRRRIGKRKNVVRSLEMKEDIYRLMSFNHVQRIEILDNHGLDISSENKIKHISGKTSFHIQLFDSGAPFLCKNSACVSRFKSECGRTLSFNPSPNPPSCISSICCISDVTSYVFSMNC